MKFRDYESPQTSNPLLILGPLHVSKIQLISPAFCYGKSFSLWAATRRKIISDLWYQFRRCHGSFRYQTLARTPAVQRNSFLALISSWQESNLNYTAFASCQILPNSLIVLSINTPRFTIGRQTTTQLHLLVSINYKTE